MRDYRLTALQEGPDLVLPACRQELLLPLPALRADPASGAAPWLQARATRSGSNCSRLQHVCAVGDLEKRLSEESAGVRAFSDHLFSIVRRTASAGASLTEDDVAAGAPQTM